MKHTLSCEINGNQDKLIHLCKSSYKTFCGKDIEHRLNKSMEITCPECVKAYEGNKIKKRPVKTGDILTFKEPIRLNLYNSGAYTDFEIGDTITVGDMDVWSAPDYIYISLVNYEDEYNAPDTITENPELAEHNMTWEQFFKIFDLSEEVEEFDGLYGNCKIAEDGLVHMLRFEDETFCGHQRTNWLRKDWDKSLVAPLSCETCRKAYYTMQARTYPIKHGDKLRFKYNYPIRLSLKNSSAYRDFIKGEIVKVNHVEGRGQPDKIEINFTFKYASYSHDTYELWLPVTERHDVHKDWLSWDDFFTYFELIDEEEQE